MSLQCAAVCFLSLSVVSASYLTQQPGGQPCYGVVRCEAEKTPHPFPYAVGAIRCPAKMWQSVGLTLLVIVATLVCALLFMLFGEFTENNLAELLT